MSVGRDRTHGGAALEITAETLVADIAAHHPRSIEVFERHGIDFCCGGRRPLGEACREHDAAVDVVAAEIAAAAAREVPEDPRVVSLRARAADPGNPVEPAR